MKFQPKDSGGPYFTGKEGTSETPKPHSLFPRVVSVISIHILDWPLACKMFVPLGNGKHDKKDARYDQECLVKLRKS